MAINDEGRHGICGGERQSVSININTIHDLIILFLDKCKSDIDSGPEREGGSGCMFSTGVPDLARSKRGGARRGYLCGASSLTIQRETEEGNNGRGMATRSRAAAAGVRLSDGVLVTDSRGFAGWGSRRALRFFGGVHPVSFWKLHGCRDLFVSFSILLGFG
ncbi:hypothetical protein NL676_016286 [Syzygium grande]|nr:hypothetical protein NL676_016286 [Syzygium grande]